MLLAVLRVLPRSARAGFVLLLLTLPPLASGCQSQTQSSSATGTSAVGSSATGENAPQQVTLALNWFPEAEHGGFYAAQVHGYFEEEGLDVKILPGGPGAPVIQQVASGRVEFAVANADQVLLGRDQQAPVRAVLTAMQNSPRCIMVHDKTGPQSLLELRDLTLAVGSGKPFAQFLLSKLPDDAQLNIIPYQGSVSLFLEREDFAQQAYVFSEPFIASRQGGDPRCLMVSDLGFNPYSSLLITRDDLVRERPELVEKMVRACRRGWQKYLEAPEETNQRIHQLNPEMSLEILAFGADELRKLCLPEDASPETLGHMTAARWEQLADQLREIGLLENPGVWREAFETRFVGSNENAATPAGVQASDPATEP